MAIKTAPMAEIYDYINNQNSCVLRGFDKKAFMEMFIFVFFLNFIQFLF
jgi:hypothetical protein